MTNSARRADSPDLPQGMLPAPRLTARCDRGCPSWPTRRWILAVFLVGWLNASLFALATPLWQAPDEPGHFEYACLLGQLRRPLTGDDRSPALQQAIIASLDRRGFWPSVREPQPVPLPASFAADPFLRRSASQVGDEPPLYYVAPAALCRLPLSLEAQARLMRLFGALLFGLAAAATAWGWAGASQRRPPGGIARLHPLCLALLPMPAFIAGSINNDALALLTATLVFAATLRGQRLGWTWQRGLGLAALAALALASKKTNAFLVPWLAALAAAGLWQTLGRRGWSGRRRTALFGVAAAAAALALLLPTPMPAGWRGVGQLPGGGRTPTTLHERPGWAVRVVDRSPRTAGRLLQDVDAPDMAALAGRPVRAVLWVRSAGDTPAPGRLLIRDAAGASQASFVAGDRWQPVTLERTLAITTTSVRLAVVPTAGGSPQETGALLVAQAALWPAEEAPGAGTLLRNGDFRQAARVGELLAVPLEAWWRQFAPRSPAAWERPERSLLYLVLAFPGYWGNFGWLQRPLPVLLYALLAGVTATAGVGVALRWRREASARAWLGAWLLAALLIALQTFIPMIGRDWQPQGRYLFPALMPLTGLLLAGLDHWLPLDGGRRRRAGLVAAVLALDLVGLATAARVL